MSEELVPHSSDEFLDHMVATVSKRIIEGKLQLEKEARERKIDREVNKHYEELARKTLEALWKECKKQTGHKRTEKGGWPVCTYCAKPLGYGDNRKTVKENAERREREGITNIAGQLRWADQKAGVEWKPGWVK